MTRHIDNTKHQEQKWYYEIGICAQNEPILGSITLNKI